MGTDYGDAKITMQCAIKYCDWIESGEQKK